MKVCLEALNSPTVRALVLEDAGVSPGLGHPGQLLVPLELHHVPSWWLGAGAHRHLGPQTVVLVQGSLHLGLNKENKDETALALSLR